MEQTFQIISYSDKGGFIPHSIKRLPDNEVFTIGDFVTNGTKMKGEITEFSLHNGTVFVTTTWSGVGMDLDSLKREVELPSAFAINQVVQMKFQHVSDKEGESIKTVWATGTVKGVHFFASAKGVTEKYDIDLWYDGGNTSYRVYNVSLNLLRSA